MLTKEQLHDKSYEAVMTLGSIIEDDFFFDLDIFNKNEVLNLFKNSHHLPHEQLNKLKTHFLDYEIYFAGPFEERCFFFKEKREQGRNVIVSLSSKIDETFIYRKYGEVLKLSNAGRYVSACIFNQSFYEKISKPLIRLVALYHPENFPLPRFPLGISDICRSLREDLYGVAKLSDMQLGKTVEDVYSEILTEKPDIIGISVTFGQQDVLEELLDRVVSVPNYNPLLVVGGSLAALNYAKILTRYPKSLIGTSTGEPTFSDVVKYWRQEINVHEIKNIAYLDENSQIKITGTLKPQHPNEGVPELDLLEETLKHNGVMQLESTRGCSYACSFCPRSHKGVWIGQSMDIIQKLLPEISNIYDRYPYIARKIFLVDEEFIGYKEDSLTDTRIKDVADTFYKYGFSFETSARVDQVYRRTKDKEWHVERIKLWKYLISHGLDRVLFGVESGVDSILARFNKKTTKQQNENAIRILSACKIPVRLTYITFDPLMTMEELIESYKFLGRKDLILKPQTLEEGDLFDAIHNEEFLQNNNQGRALYTEITYMLVSMECLIGSKYLQMVEEEGLARDYKYSMGRRDAAYRDSRIGLLSHCSQLWVDRNFSLDYTLKSVEKVSPKPNRPYVRELRNVVKKFSYEFLGKGLYLITQDSTLIDRETQNEISSLASEWLNAESFEVQKDIFIKLMNENFERLKAEYFNAFTLSKDFVPSNCVERLNEVMDDWSSRTTWKLINDF